MRRAIFIFAFFSIASVCSGAVITVDDDGPADFNNIQAAIDFSEDGDIIIIQPGIYTGNGNRDIEPNGKEIVIRSIDPNNPDIVSATIIDCNGTEIEPHRAFYFHSYEDANSVLDGLTVTNGYTSGYGGGIYCYESSPTISNCRFLNNQATRDGGAIHCYYSDSIITKCIFTNNIAYSGGAINCLSSSPVFENCIIRDNKAAGYIEGWGYNLGGGIYSGYYGFISINNCIINDNFAEHAGGGFSTQGTNSVANCTFSGNSSFMGGALHCGEYGYPYIHNCILWDNEAVNGHEIAMCTMDWQSWLTVSYSNIQGGQDEIYDIANLEWGEGNIDVDPLFSNPDANDFHLQSQGGRWDANSQSWVIDSNTSPCIDAGDWMSPVGYEPFPNGGRINMGAYGGTVKASKSYFGEPPCETIIAGDINGDCVVNFIDFAIMSFHWLEDAR